MSKFCRICHNTDCLNHGRDITFFGAGYKCNYIPVTTNADRIRAMSDEELADMRVDYDPVTDLYTTDTGEAYSDFVSAMEAELEWLQQPAEGVAEDG